MSVTLAVWLCAAAAGAVAWGVAGGMTRPDPPPAPLDDD